MLQDTGMSDKIPVLRERRLSRRPRWVLLLVHHLDFLERRAKGRTIGVARILAEVLDEAIELEAREESSRKNILLALGADGTDRTEAKRLSERDDSCVKALRKKCRPYEKNDHIRIDSKTLT